MAHEDVDRLLDDIDSLVDWQMSGGDRSDSFHGEQLRENQPCPWCPESWHFLPITQTMRDMRMGSYAVDEFGYGIVDPDYSFQADTSTILCPGSEFHGPSDKYRTWDKQSRERATERSSGTRRYPPPQDPSPDMPAGRRRRLRFFGPFDGWTVSLDEERELEDIFVGIPGAPHVRDRSRPPRTVVMRCVFTATFELDEPIHNYSSEWFNRNQAWIREIRIDPEGSWAHMEPVRFRFSNFVVFADQPTQNEPTWVEFEVAEDLPHWFCARWVWTRLEERYELRPNTSRGFESDYVIIDEAYQFTNSDQELRQYVEEAHNLARELAARCSIPPAQIEAPAEAYLSRPGQRPPILRRRPEDRTPQDRHVADGAQSEEVSSSGQSVVRTGGEASGQAEGQG